MTPEQMSAGPAMRASYSQHDLDELLAGVRTRRGWDFSGMNVLRQPVPWEYDDLVLRYLRPSDVVLDVGTCAGERLRDLASSFGAGLGIDLDPEMVRLAREGPAGNLRFLVSSEQLESVHETFDVIINRHAPFDLQVVAAHLRPGGYFITQQVGERNMAPAHADVDGQFALAGAAILNRVLGGNVDERGFVTNEHRYLAIAQSVSDRR